MPVPPPTHRCWSIAASGGLARIQTSNLALQLLIKRIETSGDSEAQKAAEVHTFFTKWERLLTTELDAVSRW